MVLLLSLPLAAVAHASDRSQLSDHAQQFDRWFEEAGAEFDVPADLLRSIAFVESRWQHRAPVDAAVRGPLGRVRHTDDDAPPPAFGVMGLHDDDFFGHSLVDAAGMIGRTPEELQLDAQLNIRGTAALLHSLGAGLRASSPMEAWEPAVAKLSGIPQEQVASVYTYDVFNSISRGRESNEYLVPARPVDLVKIYGERLLRVLSSPRITVPAGVTSQSADYGPALWNPASTCNYTVGRTTGITNVAVHTTQGSYAGTISWFQNCSAQVSAHYVIRSSDGQITQMVYEKDKAYHVGTENGYTVGIEHEGYIDNPGAWYTDAMYNASALLTRDICVSNGLDKTRVYDGGLGWNAVITDRAAVSVKGHVNFPNQTHQDPGSGWNWPKYKNLVIGSTTTTTQYLSNPGFESGYTAWVAAASSDVTTSTSYSPRSGSWYAWLGGWSTAHTDYMYQTVTIPSGITSAKLSFYLRVATAETTTTTAYDTLKVQIRDTSNNLLQQLVSLSNLSASCCYAQKSFDVSSFAGRTVRVYFEAVNDNGNQTSFLVDDTALNVTK